MRVSIDPAQLAELGVVGDASIELPDNFTTYTREEREAWARTQIEAECLNMFHEFAADQYGTVPTAAQEATYLRMMSPIIAQTVRRFGR